MVSELQQALGNDAGKVLAVLVIGMACSALVLITVTSVVAFSWRKVREREEEADLKRDMLARGLSAEDIVRVLSTSTDPNTIREQRRALRRGWNPDAKFWGAGCGTKARQS